jgi:hypothetical protein
MKKLTLSLALVLVLGGFLVPSVFAQTNTSSPGASGPVLVASVNIYNAKIVSQNGDDIKVAFDINNQSQAQPQIKYGITLVQNQKIEDEKVYDEELSLSAGQTVHREIDYTAPSFLNGKFDVWITSQNEQGLTLGLNMAGTITLNGDNQYLEINENSAALTVGTSSASYSASVGTGIEKGDALVAHYEITNHFKNDTQFLPVFDTFSISPFGALVSETKGSDTDTLKAGKTNTFSFNVPLANNPQVYSVKIYLVNQQGKVISNSEYFQYILGGASATIQNVRLDKDYYQAGDTINETLDWFAPAATFAGMATSSDSVIMKVAVQDGNGTSCADPISQNVKVDGNFAPLTFQLKATRDCLNPQSLVTIEGANGTVLAQSNFKITSQSIPAGNSKWEIIAASLIILFLIGLGIAGFAYYKKKKQSGVLMKVFFFFCISSGFLLFPHGQAKAVDYTVNANFQSDVYSINLSQPTYNQGDPIILYTSAANVKWGGRSSVSYLSSLVGQSSSPHVNGWTADVDWRLDDASYNSLTNYVSALSYSSEQESGSGSYFNACAFMHQLYLMGESYCDCSGGSSGMSSCPPFGNENQTGSISSAGLPGGNYEAEFELWGDGLYYGANQYNCDDQSQNCGARITIPFSIYAPPTGTISASPNPCTITAGNTTCTSNISWNTTNAPGAVVYIQTGQEFAAGASGSSNATWINASGYTFSLYSDTTKSDLLAPPVTVTGNGGALTVGACGSANDTIVSSAPTSSLCSNGTPSSVSGTGPWTWTCAGTSGAPVPCYANSSAASCGPTSRCSNIYNYCMANNITYDASCNVSGATYCTDTTHCGIVSGGTACPVTTACSASTCSPSAVTNGTVAAYPSCAITCNSGYVQSGSSCVPSSGGLINDCCDGSGWGYECTTATYANDPSCSSASIGGGPPACWTAYGYNYDIAYINDGCNSYAPGYDETITCGASGSCCTGTEYYAHDCSASTCSGKTCSDSCGNLYAGTKSCSTCSPSSVTNGTVNQSTCAIACNSGYTLSGSSCVASPTPACLKSVGSSDINIGDSDVLMWSCQYVSSCAEIANSDGFSTRGAVSGSALVTPSTVGQVIYGMTCGGTNFYFPAITVHSSNVTISANPTRVTSGGTSTISWTSSDVTSCAVTRNGVAWKVGLSSPGVGVVDTITGQTTYTIVCTGTGGTTAPESVMVNVLPIFQPF